MSFAVQPKERGVKSDSNDPSQSNPPAPENSKWGRILFTGALPSAGDFAESQRRSFGQIAIWTLLAALVCGLGMGAGVGAESLALPFIAPAVFLITLATPFLLWRYPRYVLYLTLAAVCLVEGAMSPAADEITGRIPFWWNINTIFQIYAHANLKAAPFSLFEVFIVSAGACSLIRSVFSGTARVRGGALLLPIAGYLAFVTIGWVNGLATGGDFKISLTEVRAQFYFGIAYLMAVNLVTERRHIDRLLWISVVCIGIKGLLYTFRRYVTLAGLPLPDQGVGSHEEAFFFNNFVLLLLTLALVAAREYKRLQTWMWVLLPLVILGNLATNRRAGTAGFIIGVVVLFLAAYAGLPRRRKMVAIVGLSMAFAFSIYYPMFKNKDGSIAQPARAIRSQFSPDERDASSNLYRDAENADLMATIKLAPVQGYGYGKPMLHVVPIADISEIYEWWDILPHNQILWVWMRVGTIGFWVFWMLIAAIVLRASALVRSAPPRVADSGDTQTKIVGLLTLMVVSQLLIFGLLDLQISNSRDMLFTGIWAGVAASGWIASRRGSPAPSSSETVTAQAVAPPVLNTRTVLNSVTGRESAVKGQTQ